MAVATTKINLYGPLFSFLFYDNARCTGDQEGFLLGKINSHLKDSVNDAQMNSRTEETIIDIHSATACESTYSFYNNCGEINFEMLNAAIGHKYESVVGWYRFRRNTNLEPLFLETIIHNNLVNHFADKRDFLFGIFTCSYNANISTHSFEHTFMKLDKKSSFDPVPLVIINLGDGSQEDYKKHHPSTVGCRLLDDSELPNTGAVIQRIQNTLEVNLRELCHQVSKSETNLQQVRREVELLRTQLQLSRAMAESPDASMALRQFPSSGAIKDQIGRPIADRNSSGSYLRDDSELLSSNFGSSEENDDVNHQPPMYN